MATDLENNVDTQKRWGRAKAKLMGHNLRPAVRSPAIPSAGVGVRHICVCRRCGAIMVVEELRGSRAIADGSATTENCDVRYERGERPAGES